MFGVQDVLALLIAAVALWYVIRFLRRAMGGSGGCKCNQGIPCSGRPKSGGTNASGIRRLPIVTLSQVARNDGDLTELADQPLVSDETASTNASRPE